MDDEGPRANGRGKPDQYKSLRSQVEAQHFPEVWILSQNHIRDQHSMKLAQALAERDAALHERNIGIAEKKQAIAERDMALMQRDQALNEMNKVIMERDSAMATLEYIRENSRNSSAPTCPSSCSDLPVAKQLHCEAPYCSREPQITETYPTSSNTDNSAKPRREKKQANEIKMLAQATTVKGKPRNGKRKKGPEEFDEQNVAVKQLEWKRHDMTVADLNKVNSASKNGWKGQDIGLNDVFFDDSTMPVPGCSCTGIWRQCYKWGNGGWQSACCTTTLSMHPLPMMPNRKHARVGGRKMSGGAFNKLLSRLAAEGHDLSMPVDLKTHWAKHGTNRYITIK